MSKYNLTYFPTKALAEPIRFLLSYGGVDFEDNRFTYEDWPKIKATMPFGQVPLLEVDGKKTDQSVAICRYLAKQFGLTGRDDWEDLEIDAAVDTIHDFRMKIHAYHYEPNQTLRSEKYGPLVSEIIPYYLSRLEAQVKDNGGYLVGGRLTWADLVFVALLDFLDYMAKFNLVEKYSSLRTLKTQVLTIPRIKEWINKRPFTDH